MRVLPLLLVTQTVFAGTGNVVSYDTLDLLLANSNPNSVSTELSFKGRNSVNDGGGGTGIFVQDTAPTNLGTIFNSQHPNGSGWQFKRKYDGALNPLWFGAKGTGIDDDTIAMQAAFTAGDGKTIHIPSGIYLLSNLSNFLSQSFSHKITGDGPDKSILRANGVVNEWLRFGNVTMRDVGLDGNLQAARITRIAGNGDFRNVYVHGARGNTSQPGYGFYQDAASTNFNIIGCSIWDIGGVTNSDGGDSIGAHAAIQLSGLNGKVVGNTIWNVQEYEDTDIIRVSGQRSVKAIIIDNIVNNTNAIKRVVKLQANDCTVSNNRFVVHDESQPSYAGVDTQGDNNIVSGNYLWLDRFYVGLFGNTYTNNSFVGNTVLLNPSSKARTVDVGGTGQNVRAISSIKGSTCANNTVLSPYYGLYSVNSGSVASGNVIQIDNGATGVGYGIQTGGTNIVVANNIVSSLNGTVLSPGISVNATYSIFTGNVVDGGGATVWCVNLNNLTGVRVQGNVLKGYTADDGYRRDTISNLGLVEYLDVDGAIYGYDGEATGAIATKAQVYGKTNNVDRVNLYGMDSLGNEFPITGYAASGNGTINIKDYGAKGDGISNDTAAWNAAIAAAAGTTMVVLPSGSYLVNGTNIQGNSVTNAWVNLATGTPIAQQQQTVAFRSYEFDLPTIQAHTELAFDVLDPQAEAGQWFRAFHPEWPYLSIVGSCTSDGIVHIKLFNSNGIIINPMVETFIVMYGKTP